MCFKWYKTKFGLKSRPTASSGTKLVLLFFLFFVFQTTISAQSNVATVGIQYKPIFSFGLTGGGVQKSFSETLGLDIQLSSGSSFGLVVRKGINKSLSFETGMNLITRNFRLGMEDLDSNFTTNVNYKLINYEIPIQGLVYVRMGENLWINTTAGFSFNVYPTNVKSQGDVFSQFTKRQNQLQFAVVANIGFEYRTEKNGYFYVGTSLYNPFNKIATTTAEYEQQPLDIEFLDIDVSGNYLTLDLRYFFHEKPEKN